MKNINYPFVAIVGQEKLKKALLLNVINPKIGGILIKGEKGTAKSTIVRSLGDIVLAVNEAIESKKKDDRCKDYSKYEDILIENKGLIAKRKSGVINLPLGATEDRVVGSIDIEKALIKGEKAFEPGILSEADGNILYVDEINLLDDNIVDILLDVAAMGVNRVEREGISFEHKSKFMLVGTMNEEEGELRPQLLDRFGFSIAIEGEKEIEKRTEIIERILAFEENQEDFVEEYKDETLSLIENIKSAKELLENMKVSKEILELIAKISISAEVDGHRADLTIIKAAKANAAYNKRTEVLERDVLEVIKLVLAHRMKKFPFESKQKQDKLDELLQEKLDNSKKKI